MNFNNIFHRLKFLLLEPIFGESFYKYLKRNDQCRLTIDDRILGVGNAAKATNLRTEHLHNKSFSNLTKSHNVWEKVNPWLGCLLAVCDKPEPKR